MANLAEDLNLPLHSQPIGIVNYAAFFEDFYGDLNGFGIEHVG